MTTARKIQEIAIIASSLLIWHPRKIRNPAHLDSSDSVSSKELQLKLEETLVKIKLSHNQKKKKTITQQHAHTHTNPTNQPTIKINHHQILQEP